MHRLSLTLMALNFVIPSWAAAEQCSGQLFGINSQRGAQGIIFSLDEINSEASAQAPAALFSSSAMAYDSQTKRLYYTSANRPITYKVDVSNLSIPEGAVLPVQGQKYRTSKLAYYDLETNTHTEVGKSKALMSLVYDQENSRLLGASSSKLYEVDPNTGSTTELMALSDISGRYRGDLAFYDDKLMMVTSTTVYQVDIANSTLTQLSKHGLSSVTGASLNINNELVISRVLQNDSGHTNESKLYKLLPYTGETCFIAKVPVRLNDLAFADVGSSTCYEVVDCDDMPSFSVEAITDTVQEGGTLSYRVTLSETYREDVTFKVEVIDVTTVPGDYTSPNAELVITAGAKSADIIIATNNDTVYSGDRSLTLKVTGVTNTQGNSSLTGTIEEDESEFPSVSLSAVNDSVVEGGTLTYTATLSRTYSKPVKLNVSVTDITTRPTDYTSPAAILVIPANTQSVNISIATNNDSVYVGDRELRLSVSANENVTGNGSLTGTIKEDEVIFNCNGFDRVSVRVTSSRYGPGKFTFYCNTGRVEFTENRYSPNMHSGLALTFHPSGRKDLQGQSTTISQTDMQKLKGVWYSGNHDVYPGGAGCHAGQANKHLSTVYWGGFSFDRNTNTMSCQAGMVSQYCTGGNADSRFDIVESHQCVYEGSSNN